MDFKYDLVTGSNDPVVRDVPMYDATLLALGELLMLGNTAPDSAADHGVAFQTAYESSQSTSAIDALGICMEAETPTTVPGDGQIEYYKAVINPFAIYYAEYSQGTSDDVAITTGSTSTTVTIGSLEDDIDCGWLYFPLASGGAQYKLRYISASASGSCTISQAITVTTSDTCIKVLPPNHRLVSLTTDAKKLLSQAAAGDCVAIHVMKNWIMSAKYAPLEMNKAYTRLQGDTDAQPSDTKIYAEIALLDHVYNMGD